MTLRERLAEIISGDALDDVETLAKYSRDTSIFTRTPQVVVFPKHEDDVAALVKFVHAARASGENLTLTGRSAGTDMTGGPLTNSISVVFTKYMNHVTHVGKDFASTEPGVYYRDFEKITLSKNGMIFAPYPASRELCAMGGIVSNNSGGELTLRYGKTNKYVRDLQVVLSDGSKAEFKPLSESELIAKKGLQNLEGKIYRDIDTLLQKNKDEIERNTPNVTKNSAGYALWNIYDSVAKTFDLTQLIVGSQGTLALVTEATLGLIKPNSHRAMLIIFMSDIGALPEIVKRVLHFKPESFESYDDKTFSLAVRFLPQMLMQLGFWQAIKLGFAFLPEVWTVIRGGIPKLILMAEFAEMSTEDAIEKVRHTREALNDMPVQTRIAKSEIQAEKYWKVRRESFALLRKNVKGRYAASFIDDVVVHPDDYPTFLPELYALVSGHRFIYTIAGHIGDGNFHVIPLVDMSHEVDRRDMLDLMPKVYALVAKYHGSITGEHNDGIIRTPYLPLMFSPRMIELFAEVKNIFDPLGVFNPGKKVGGTLEDIEKSVMTHV